MSAPLIADPKLSTDLIVFLWLAKLGPLFDPVSPTFW